MIELKSVSGILGVGAVCDVSFRLPNGKTYGVFSPRYADAVCLCSLMSGALTPTGGSVLAGGFDLHREAKQARRGIGFLPEELLPDDELTPLEYLMAIAELREPNYDKALRHVHELLELGDLSDKKDSLVAKLSFGDGRLLCILQALLGKPEILILTSPLSGLIPKDVQKVRELIRYLSDTYTIFLCTPSAHDLREMCDEILILQGGTLKSVLSSSDETLAAELSAVPNEASPSPSVDSPKTSRANALFKMLTQKSDDYEVLDADEKEGKN